jgi:hypothetical protein
MCSSPASGKRPSGSFREGSRVIGPNILRGRTLRYAFLLASAAFLVFISGCYRTARMPEQEFIPPSKASGSSESSATSEEGAVPSRPQTAHRPASEKVLSSPPEIPEPVKVPEETITEFPPDPLPMSAGEPTPTEGDSSTVLQPQKTVMQGEGVPEDEGDAKEIAEVAMEETTDEWDTGDDTAEEGVTVAAVPPPGPPSPPISSQPRPEADRERVVIARLPDERMFPQDGPLWAKGKEELSYKVDFLGLTMGYARFIFLGKVLLSGKEAYHLRVRFWTTGLLSLMFPFDDTIDYYLDVHSIAPLRQEFTRGARSKKEDDVATFNQEKGTIVYRYKKNGKVRKKVDAVPNVYDPVSVAYYLRTRDLEGEDNRQSMYVGRKLYEITAKRVGFERIRTDRGEFDTIVIQPELRREGKVKNKRKIKMRMWMTRDEWHVPVRLYAKFRKIRTWTLVGELLPDRQGG